MADEFITTTEVPIEKKPDLISVLGILGFINTGIFTLLYGLGIFAVKAFVNMDQVQLDEIMQQVINTYGDAVDPAQMSDMMNLFRESGTMIMVALFVLTLVRLFSIMQMWKLKKMGFFIYLPAQIARIFVVALFMGIAYIGMFGPIMAVAMCAAWGSQLKHMR